MEYTVRSLDEIESLKAQWRNDPHWDIEHTSGFEVWHDELQAFSDAVKKANHKREMDRLWEMSRGLGIEGNFALTRYIDSLEQRIHRIEVALIDARIG